MPWLLECLIGMSLSPGAGTSPALSTLSGLLLDRDANQAAPLGPGPIIVAHARIAQQIVQYKPGMAAALPNATIGHHLFVRRDTLACIQHAQFLRWLEGAIFLDGHRPGNVGRPWNMPPALRAFLGQMCRSKQLTTIFRRRAHIHQGNLALLQ